MIAIVILLNKRINYYQDSYVNTKISDDNKKYLNNSGYFGAFLLKREKILAQLPI